MWHISLLFVTTGPGTESASPGDVNLLNPVFLWIVLTLFLSIERVVVQADYQV